jgi:hypothetical protein
MICTVAKGNPCLGFLKDGYCFLKDNCIYQKEEKEGKMKCERCGEMIDTFCSTSEPVHTCKEKMKCKKCGSPFSYTPEGDDYCKTCNPVLHKSWTKPNPSPQQIFQHIKTDCERKAFDEFMNWIGGWQSVRWHLPLPDEAIKVIKMDNPEWYKWLCDEGLVQKKMVKREAWVQVFCERGCLPWVSHTYFSKEEDGIKDGERRNNYIKTILVHTWEEEEK